MKNLAIVLFSLLTTFAFAQTHPDAGRSYTSVQTNYDRASKPSTSRIDSFWTGICYKPNGVKAAGALAFKVKAGGRLNAGFATADNQPLNFFDGWTLNLFREEIDSGDAWYEVQDTGGSWHYRVPGLGITMKELSRGGRPHLFVSIFETTNYTLQYICAFAGK